MLSLLDDRPTPELNVVVRIAADTFPLPLSPSRTGDSSLEYPARASPPIRRMAAPSTPTTTAGALRRGE